MENELNRRDFLKKTTAAAIAAMAVGAPMTGLLSSCSRDKIISKADSVILLYMSGGMAHTETFDPKRYTPFTPGMQANDVDRKSTRLNSSHVKISYAVFCLKKKKIQTTILLAR